MQRRGDRGEVGKEDSKAYSTKKQRRRRRLSRNAPRGAVRSRGALRQSRSRERAASRREKERKRDRDGLTFFFFFFFFRFLLELIDREVGGGKNLHKKR